MGCILEILDIFSREEESVDNSRCFLLGIPSYFDVISIFLTFLRIRERVEIFFDFSGNAGLVDDIFGGFKFVDSSVAKLDDSVHF